MRVVEFVKLLDERHFRSGRARFGLWDLRLIGNAEAVLSIGSLTLSSLHLSNKPKCQSFIYGVECFVDITEGESREP